MNLLHHHYWVLLYNESINAPSLAFTISWRLQDAYYNNTTPVLPDYFYGSKTYCVCQEETLDFDDWTEVEPTDTSVDRPSLTKALNVGKCTGKTFHR
jgi:hypothetical protein